VSGCRAELGSVILSIKATPGLDNAAVAYVAWSGVPKLPMGSNLLMFRNKLGNDMMRKRVARSLKSREKGTASTSSNFSAASLPTVNERRAVTYPLSADPANMTRLQCTLAMWRSRFPASMSEMKSFTWLVHRSLTCYFLVGCLFIPTNVNKIKKRKLAIESAIKVSNSLSLPNKTRFGVCACESGNFDIDTKDRFAIVLISKLLVKMPVERRVQLVGRPAATIHAVLEEVIQKLLLSASLFIRIYGTHQCVVSIDQYYDVWCCRLRSKSVDALDQIAKVPYGALL
jgi:hypothetical protein